MASPPDKWISNARLVQYQALLLNPSRVQFQSSTALNPATLLPDPDLEGPLHDCETMLDSLQGIRAELTDIPLKELEANWFTDGSSFMKDGVRYAGAVVTSQTKVIWAEAVPTGTSAQKAELIASVQLVPHIIYCTDTEFALRKSPK